ncbi:DUF6465 family protein [Butyrivibrio sp. AC2005]|uniref:DUF6465 family protein n=1 Tax=Butyrivibrio sp. AC2005 TaxID=1280672 RepID=UPI00041E1026|nr:DUF6465 family protein [Butyrivibrio sp. AC2005]
MARAKKTPKEATKTKVTAAAAKLAEAVVTKKAVTPKKTATPKKAAASETKTNLVLQFAGKDLSYDELVQNAKNVFQYDMAGDPASIKEISLFIKPEENKVYFVIDGAEGSYDL